MKAFKAHALLPERPYTSYDDYRANAGVDALAKAREREPQELIEEIRESGLRGRGGAGFPTGVKWQTIHDHPCPTRFVVCNAAEGEPGTFKDRWLLRQNPYAVLEGMLIAAHAVGAKRAFLGLKKSFTKEVARVKAALDEMTSVLGGVEITIVEGPEDYLFGEERALLEVIEGNDPLPREADDMAYEHGLFATPGSPNPALMNNAETLAHVPSIVRHGASSFRELGTPETPGTLLFTMSGDIRRPGVYEREAGIPLRLLVNTVGGGMGRGRTFKAILPGVSSRLLGPEDLELSCDFESMKAAGSGLGSAGFVVYDDRRSGCAIAQMAAEFLYQESCSQCSACKSSLGIAAGAMNELASGAPARDLVDRAIAAAHRAPQGNRCYLPVQGSILLPSVLTRFRGEIEGKRAPVDTLARPKIIDYDEEGRRFIYADEELTNSVPASEKRPKSAAFAPSARRGKPGSRTTGPLSRAS